MTPAPDHPAANSASGPAAASAPDPGTSWRGTRALIGSDFRRLRAHLARMHAPTQGLYVALLPNFQALLWYRLAHWLLLRGWALPARLVSLFALYLTRAELSPEASIGPAALLVSAHMVHVFGRIGARVTLHGYCGTGGGFGVEDVGAGPGYPWIGDDVEFGYGSVVLGPRRIGDRARLGVSSMVLRDVPADAVVAAAPSPVRPAPDGPANGPGTGGTHSGRDSNGNGDTLAPASAPHAG
jgi:serine O-acetyltransferase